MPNRPTSRGKDASFLRTLPSLNTRCGWSLNQHYSKQQCFQWTWTRLISGELCTWPCVLFGHVYMCLSVSYYGAGWLQERTGLISAWPQHMYMYMYILAVIPNEPRTSSKVETPESALVQLGFHAHCLHWLLLAHACQCSLQRQDNNITAYSFWNPWILYTFLKGMVLAFCCHMYYNVGVHLHED